MHFINFIESIVFVFIGIILLVIVIDIYCERKKGSHWGCIFGGHIPSIDGKKVPNPKGLFENIGAVFGGQEIRCIRCDQELKWMARFNSWIIKGEFS